MNFSQIAQCKLKLHPCILFSKVLLVLSMALTAQIPERTFYITPDGDTDCSDNHCGLQAALDSAAIDSANITFLLAEGTYTGHYSLEPDSADCYGDLTFEGGWNPDFTERSGAKTTVFDGQGQVQALYIRKYLSKMPGAIYIDNIKVVNCVSAISGGGMLVQSYGDDITISNCIIMNNKASTESGTGGSSGGGISTYTFNLETNDGGTIRYENNYIAGNIAGYNVEYGQGGGIFSYVTDSLVLINNVIVNNQALGYIGIGGGIELYSRQGEVLFVNNVFSGNYAYHSGGGTANHITSPIGPTNLEYVNNIVYGNSISSGYGTDAYSAVRTINENTVTIAYHNNIIGQHGTYPGTINPVYTNNENIDPKFVDTLYHVSSSSLAIDAGDNNAPLLPEFDYFGNDRVQYEQVDMGAHEHDGLVVHYKLDGNAKDAGLNGIDGNFFTGSGHGVTNIEETALHNVSDTQRVFVPHNDELNIPDEITISFWCDADSLNFVSHLLSKCYTCNHNGNYHVYLGRGGGLSSDFDRPTFSYSDGTGSTKMYICNDTIRKEEWNHIAICYNFSTYGMQLYLNGNPVSGFWYDGNVPEGTPVIVSYPLGIGASITAENGCNDHLAGEGQYPFYGRIDDVKIYNRALSEQQIHAISNFPPSDIVLSSAQVNENLPAETVVATLSATDPNANDEHTFELVTGEDGTHNELFEIELDQLKLASSINFEEQPDCSVLIKATDPEGESIETIVDIEVKDMNDPPVLQIPLVNQTATVGASFSYIFDENTFTDEDTWDHLTYSAALSDKSDLPSWLAFQYSNREFSGVPIAHDNYSVVVTATDDSSATATGSFNIQVDPSSIENQGTQEFSLYPQPIHDFVLVKSEAGKYKNLKIYNITGQLVQDQLLEPGGQTIINLSHLETGLYFYKAKGKVHCTSGRFVKR